MNKGRDRMAMLTWVSSGFLACVSPAVLAQIYKVVDAEGNIVYTDQAPADGSAPMDLPELSIIKSDYVPDTSTADIEPATEETGAGAGEEDATSPRALRKTYSDFHISQPAQEQTFWGTENTVVIGWSSSAPLLPDLSVRLFVDGLEVTTTTDTLYAVTLVRGEHSTHAELLDSRGRRIVTTPSVIFFVKQQSIGFNQPRATSRNGT